MQHEIVGNPDYGQLTVHLDAHEKFIGEGGSMAWMSDGTELRSRLPGGFLKALLRKLLHGSVSRRDTATVLTTVGQKQRPFSAVISAYSIS